MSGPRPVVVVLGTGSPSPARIARAAGPDRRVVFVAEAGGVAPATAALARSVGDLLEPDQLPDTTRPSAVITFSDSCLRLAARLAEQVGVHRPSERTLAALTDKSVQRRALADAGVDHCRSTSPARRPSSSGRWPTPRASPGWSNRPAARGATTPTSCGPPASCPPTCRSARPGRSSWRPIWPGWTAHRWVTTSPSRRSSPRVSSPRSASPANSRCCHRSARRASSGRATSTRARPSRCAASPPGRSRRSASNAA